MYGRKDSARTAMSVMQAVTACGRDGCLAGRGII